ncbi:MAG: response regulator [Methylococcaceae bacterium]|nr:response regulator [Methylococcaceae bacterium]
MADKIQTSRTILLVDDEPNITSALKRTLRRDGYNILTANSGEEGLNLLAVHEVGVIISDQRMPHMTGVEFLRKVKALYPKTFRMVLSGYTELESVTSAINEGAIYKFLTKPWDDDQLRENTREAFQRYEMEQDNFRLTKELQSANDKLSRLNLNLEQQVADKTREIVHNINLLEISQEILESLPIAILGIDEQEMIAASNKQADVLVLGKTGGCLLGTMASDYLPDILLQMLQKNIPADKLEFDGYLVRFTDDMFIRVWISPMGEASRSKGKIVVIIPVKEA